MRGGCDRGLTWSSNAAAVTAISWVSGASPLLLQLSTKVRRCFAEHIVRCSGGKKEQQYSPHHSGKGGAFVACSQVGWDTKTVRRKYAWKIKVQ